MLYVGVVKKVTVKEVFTIFVANFDPSVPISARSEAQMQGSYISEVHGNWLCIVLHNNVLQFI
jgi:hypothetical protein